MEDFLKDQIKDLKCYTNNYTFTENEDDTIDVVYSEDGKKKLVWMGADFMDIDLILTEAIASYQRGEEEPNAKLANRKASAAVNDVDELRTKLEEIKAPSFCYIIGDGRNEHERWELSKRVVGYWTIGYWERGKLTMVQCFDTETAACSAFFDEVQAYTDDVKKHFDAYARQYAELRR